MAESFLRSQDDDPDFEFLAPNKKKLAEERGQPFDSKKNCWIPDAKEGYVKAEIISTKGEEVQVITEKMEVRFILIIRLLLLLLFVRGY